MQEGTKKAEYITCLLLYTRGKSFASLEPKTQLIPSENWWFPLQGFGLDPPTSFSLGLVILFHDRVI